MPRISVLIVDDSAVVRQVLSEILREDPGIEVLGAASDPIFARRRMNLRWPDVMIVDVEMPRMDGITFLRRIMAERPTPVVICSSLTKKGAETTMQALSAGAVEVIGKPQLGVKGFLQEGASELIGAVKAAARANLRHVRPFAAESTVPKGPRTEAVRVAAVEPRPGTARRVVAIGASTGGTQALEVILARLPHSSPGLVIVEHMPEKFTAAFAGRLNTLSE
ncbi:MAG TPA: response regulator, partial [Chromatiales bacterium]|nr:response regulator [Chromatiales bacterium]